MLSDVYTISNAPKINNIMKIKLKNGIFVESGHRMKPARLSGKNYGRAIAALICVCTDIAIVGKKDGLIYLPERKVKPMKGWWNIGGRRFVGETAPESAVRNFIKETGLSLSPKRFTLVTIREAVWKDRKETPQNVGKHDLIHIFAVDLNKKELRYVSQNLCPEEYHSGLSPFTRKKLIQEKVHPLIVSVYDEIFGAGPVRT